MPLVMMFDMPDGIEMVDSEVQKIGEELDVAISIKPKHRQGSKSVLIKAQERSASSIYSARFRLIKGVLRNPLVFALDWITLNTSEMETKFATLFFGCI